MMILLLHTLCTFFLLGMIWFVQIVHYPLMGMIPADVFYSYEIANIYRTTMVVSIPFVLEALTGLWLYWRGVSGIAHWRFRWGLWLIAFIWLSSAVFQIPAYFYLSKELTPTVHAFLVYTNWLRTLAWSLRSLLLFGVMRQSMGVIIPDDRESEEKIGD